jgi:hypothetical protein
VVYFFDHFQGLVRLVVGFLLGDRGETPKAKAL